MEHSQFCWLIQYRRSTFSKTSLLVFYCQRELKCASVYTKSLHICHDLDEFWQAEIKQEFVRQVAWTYLRILWVLKAKENHKLLFCSRFINFTNLFKAIFDFRSTNLCTILHKMFWCAIFLVSTPCLRTMLRIFFRDLAEWLKFFANFVILCAILRQQWRSWFSALSMV